MIPPVNKPMESSLIAENADQVKAVEAMDEENIAPVGTEQIKKFMQILRKYKTGKARTEQRIVASENWWKLRNTTEEQKTTAIGKDGGFTSKSAWLHNVIKATSEAELSEAKIIVAQIVYAGSIADAEYRPDWADALVKCLFIEDWSYDNLKLAVESAFGVCLDYNVPIQEYFASLDMEVIE